MAPGHRRPAITCDGDLIIDGHVRLRLLGLPLLDLDAHVVVAPARPAMTGPASAPGSAPPGPAAQRQCRPCAAAPGGRPAAGVPQCPPRRGWPRPSTSSPRELTSLDEASRIH